MDDTVDGRAGPACRRDPSRKAIAVVRIQMVREGRFPYGSTAISQSSDAAKLVQTYLAGADREYFVLLLLDGKHRVNALNVVAIGSLTAALVHAREVFKPAVLANAAAVILAHNHPSGDPEPSREDRELTERLVKAGRLLGITVLDHVIVGEERFYSFADQHLIPNGGSL
jgi:DNA repair protein RadC